MTVAYPRTFWNRLEPSSLLFAASSNNPTSSSSHQEYSEWHPPFALLAKPHVNSAAHATGGRQHLHGSRSRYYDRLLFGEQRRFQHNEYVILNQQREVADHGMSSFLLRPDVHQQYQSQMHDPRGRLSLKLLKRIGYTHSTTQYEHVCL